ncbi:MAG: heme-binding domain-containing protein [Candidatus Zixiibacteriota bacterium]
MARKRKPLIALLILFVILLILQVFPVTRDNPDVHLGLDFNENPQVRQVLATSCYDCHSNETKWPWYSYVAPVSWLVAGDVEEGREHLNFSNWGLMSEDKQAHAREEILEEIEEGKMPLDIYLIMHADAALSDADKQVIRNWAKASPTQTEHEDEE